MDCTTRNTTEGTPRNARRQAATEARWLRLITVAIATLATMLPVQTPTYAQEQGLRIVVIQGEDLVNIIGQGTAVPTIVEVRDENDLPVAGALITFGVGESAPATLNAGLQQVTATTNALGQAGVTINPVAAGSFEVSVGATYQGQAGAATIVQTNFETAAQAAAAGGAASSGAAGATTGAGAGTGGGLGTGALVGIIGGAGGAAAAVAAATGGDDRGSRSEPQPPRDDENDDDDDDGTRNGEGNGNGNDPPTATAPEQVAAPTVTSGDGELRVDWQAPADNGSPINDYDVRYRPQGRQWNELPDNARSTATDRTIQNLTNGTTYEVQVRAGNAIGEGPWSPEATGTPKGPQPHGVKRDRDALIDLYNATNGPEWTFNKNWNTDAALAEWDGVTTNERGEVTELGLPFFNLRGRLPETLGQLKRLRVLHLDHNYLTGPIPRSLTGLQELKAFTARSNDLTGSIPRRLGIHKELEDFWLFFNQLTGTIPEHLCKWEYEINPQKGGWLECETSPTNGLEPWMTVRHTPGSEGIERAVTFTVDLDTAAGEPVTVDYGTVNGSGVAGREYQATAGRLTFQPGETSKSIQVPLVRNAESQGTTKFGLTLSNPTGARLKQAHATGTIGARRVPAALAARFGRATAEHVVDHVQYRMAAPRGAGFRARFAGKETEHGNDRNIALDLLNGLGERLVGTRTAGHGRSGAEPWRERGRDMPGLAPAGQDILDDAELELNRRRRGSVFSVWSRTSRSSFDGRHQALALNGDVRTTMIGADYTRGRLTTGVSMARSQGQGRYDGSTSGTAEASTTGLYPWLGYRLNERVSVWSVTGWSAGSLQLTTGTGTPLEHGLSTRMAAAGTRGELMGSSHRNGFRLAFKADALWVGTSVAGAEAGHDGHQDAQSTVTRLRTAIEASRELTVLGRIALAPSVEIGLRHDGGDAETGAGIDLSAGVAVTDQATGLSVDVRVRTLLAHQAVGYTSRGMSLSLGWDPRPSSPLGLTARVAPSWGAPDPSELWTSPAANHAAAYGPAAETGRIDALLGYGLPIGRSLVGTPTVGFGSASYGRNLRIGYGLRPMDTGQMELELGVETMLRSDPAGNGTDTGLAGQARVRW